MELENSKNEIRAKIIMTGNELFTLLNQAASVISLAQILYTT